MGATRDSLIQLLRTIRERLIDSPTGVTFDDIYEVAAECLSMTGGQHMLRFMLFQLELDDLVIKDDRGGTAYFKLTSNGFLKEARYQQATEEESSAE
jgi:hypothetical protein